MNSTVIGLDIAKQVFHVYQLDGQGQVVKKKLKRKEVLVYFAAQPQSVVGLEACGGSHYWARCLKELGYEVVLLNARYVKAYHREQKRFQRRGSDPYGSQPLKQKVGGGKKP